MMSFHSFLSRVIREQGDAPQAVLVDLKRSLKDRIAPKSAGDCVGLVLVYRESRCNGKLAPEETVVLMALWHLYEQDKARAA